MLSTYISNNFSCFMLIPYTTRSSLKFVRARTETPSTCTLKYDLKRYFRYSTYRSHAILTRPHFTLKVRHRIQRNNWQFTSKKKRSRPNIISGRTESCYDSEGVVLKRSGKSITLTRNETKTNIDFVAALNLFWCAAPWIHFGFQNHVNLINTITS